MTVTDPAHTADPERSTQPISPLWVKLAVATVLLALAGLVGYGIRAQEGTRGHVSTGRAYLGTNQGAVKVNGTEYGFAINPNTMIWYDANGSHDGGIPPCLQQRPGFAWIRFGYSTVYGPDESSWHSVNWVQCVHRP